MALPLTAGFTIEGLCSGEAPEQRLQVVADVQRALPQQLPKIAHGIQRLDEIIDAVALGIDMFGAPSGTGSRDNLGGGEERDSNKGLVCWCLCPFFVSAALIFVVRLAMQTATFATRKQRKGERLWLT